MPRTVSHNVLVSVLATIAVGVICSTRVGAAQEITIDHKKAPDAGKVYTFIEKRSFDAGELFTVVFVNTDPDQFDYEIEGILPLDDETGARVQVTTDKKVLNYKHDPKYGGYIVTVRGKQNAKLGNMEITIYAETVGWRVGFGGGFVGSGLTDEKYFVSDSTGGLWSSNETAYLKRDESAEDAVRLGIASFVHVWHSNPFPNNALNTLRHFAISFGIGLEAGSNITYYAGPSWRWGEKGTLTAGIAVGSVTTKPTGTLVDNPVENPANLTSNLGRRTTGSFFLAFTYTFAGGGQADLNKPFAGVGSVPR